MPRTTMLMALLQGFDYLSTIRAVAHGAAELNWFIAPSGHLDFSRLAISKILSMVLFGFIIWRTKNPRLGWILCALFAVIVISNLAL